MAHGQNAQKASLTSKEWWGRRPLSGYYGGGKNKKLLHKMERAIAKVDLRRDLDSQC